MQLVIDNTRRSGNFFDNLLNDNMFISVYDISDNTDINELIHENDYAYFQNSNYDLMHFDNTSKYDYINENNIDEYINSEYETLYKEKYKDMFKLSLSQYKQYLDFYNEHKKCLIDEKTGRHKFGAIGGGITKEYKIKNVEDNNLFLFNIYAKCLECDSEKELENINSIDDIDDKVKESYELECKYGPKFDKVEFYRFMEIYNDHKYEDLTIGFMATGLGHMVFVRTKDFEYNITNIDSW